MTTPPTASKQFTRLTGLLKTLFQLDQPELDFGLYKIMHAKSREITRFLEHDLPREVQAAFGSQSQARLAQAQITLDAAINQALLYGAPDPEAAPGVQSARAAYAKASGSSLQEADIYDHLYRFFERYYDNGDFLSRRYYARESDTRAAPYSVPYDGREVYLHWANKDQYYIKSSETLSNFSFDLTQSLRQLQGDTGSASLDLGPASLLQLKVHLRIAQATEGDHGNIKTTIDQKREFIPLLSQPAEINAKGELILNFEYKVLPSGLPVDEAAEKALQDKYDFSAKGDVGVHWMADVFLQALTLLSDLALAPTYARLLATPAPTDKQKKRPLLAKYIAQYTARNTMDYFIHKDLGGFLRRELDFYIKNEIMRLDDIDQAESPQVEQYLGKIKVLRRIAHPLIDFVAQLEDFQKKLWLKKKFVTETHYCITLDRVPQALYPAIAANEAQRREWVKLLAIDQIAGDLARVGYSVPLTVAFLQENPGLLVDTALFCETFKAALLDAIPDLDAQCDGVLIHSENFQALGFMQEKYRERVKCIYIDPPYNTGSDGFAYKDTYGESSWMSFIYDRISLGKNLLQDNGFFFASIDDFESVNLQHIVKDIFGADNFLLPLYIQVRFDNKTLSEDSDFHKVIEQVMVCSKSEKSIINKDKEEYKIDKFEWKITENFIGEDFQVNGKKVTVFKEGEWSITKISPSFVGLKETWATGSLARQKGSSGEFFELHLAPRKTADGLNCLYKVVGIGEDGLGYRYFSGPKKESTTKGKFYSGIPLQTLTELKSGDAYKGKPISNYFDFSGDFGNCRLEGNVDIRGGKKPEKLIKKIIEISSKSDSSDLVLDFYSGSGTTPSVAYKIGKKFIAVEIGDHFDGKIINRMKSTLFGNSGGVESIKQGGLFKYLRLESYEDTLNNLALKPDAARDAALNHDNADYQRDYLLHYWLDVETRGSQSLLNIESIRDPMAYTLKVKKPGSDAQTEQPIDLIETFNWLIGLWVTHLGAPMIFDAEFEREVDPDLPQGRDTHLVCAQLLQRPAASENLSPKSAATPVNTAYHAINIGYWLRLIEGYTLPTPGDDNARQKTLVVWRRLTDDAEKDSAVLETFLMHKLQSAPPEAAPYAVIYVNGSHTLPHPLLPGLTTLVCPIEEAFHGAMWAKV